MSVYGGVPLIEVSVIRQPTVLANCTISSLESPNWCCKFSLENNLASEVFFPFISQSYQD